MKAIYFMIAILVGFACTTCTADAQQETLPVFGPIEIGTHVVNGSPVQPWAYAQPIQPDSSLFPTQRISIPVPTGIPFLDLLQLGILAWLGWRAKMRKDEP